MDFDNFIQTEEEGVALPSLGKTQPLLYSSGGAVTKIHPGLLL